MYVLWSISCHKTRGAGDPTRVPFVQASTLFTTPQLSKQVISYLKYFVPQWLSSVMLFDRKDALSHNKHCKCTIRKIYAKIYTFYASSSESKIQLLLVYKIHAYIYKSTKVLPRLCRSCHLNLHRWCYARVKVSHIFFYNIDYFTETPYIFCLFEDVSDCRDLRRTRFKWFASLGLLVSVT